jgi:uncharacterized protein YoxC
MDEEKMQRQMEFLLEWQAQFAAKLGELENDSKQTHENIKRTDESVTRLGGIVEQLIGIVERMANSVTHLAHVTTERFEAVDRRDDETDRKIAALVDAQIQTEQAIRNLAATVDRHIVEGHDGRARPEG